MATIQQAQQTAVKPKRRKRWGKGEIKRTLEYLLMTLPGSVFLILFCYIPMPGIILAFQQYTMKMPTQNAGIALTSSAPG